MRDEKKEELCKKIRRRGCNDTDKIHGVSNEAYVCC